MTAPHIRAIELDPDEIEAIVGIVALARRTNCKLHIELHPKDTDGHPV